MSTIGGHIPANRWSMASTRIGKYAFSMDLHYLFLPFENLNRTAQDYCSQKVSGSQVYQTWGRLDLILENLCAHVCGKVWFKRLKGNKLVFHIGIYLQLFLDTVYFNLWNYWALFLWLAAKDETEPLTGSIFCTSPLILHHCHHMQ